MEVYIRRRLKKKGSPLWFEMRHLGLMAIRTLKHFHGLGHSSRAFNGLLSRLCETTLLRWLGTSPTVSSGFVFELQPAWGLARREVYVELMSSLRRTAGALVPLGVFGRGRRMTNEKSSTKLESLLPPPRWMRCGSMVGSGAVRGGEELEDGVACSIGNDVVAQEVQVARTA